MSQQRQRYRRTERPQRAEELRDARSDAHAEEDAEVRGRYGGFVAYMTIFLTIGAIAAVIGTIIFWPD
jgi:hypothetical protein